MGFLMIKSDLSLFECWVSWDTLLDIYIYLCGCIISVLGKVTKYINTDLDSSSLSEYRNPPYVVPETKPKNK